MTNHTEVTQLPKNMRSGMVSPDPVDFEDLGPCYFRVVQFRHPKKGEYYLSGALIQAWLAPNDLLSEYWVVLPTYKARKVWSWEPAEEV